MNIKYKREAGYILGRDGIAERIVQIAKEISEGSYKDALSLGGRIYVLIQAASYDDYWGEKVSGGIYREENVLRDVICGNISKERAMKGVKL